MSETLGSNTYVQGSISALHLLFKTDPMQTGTPPGAPGTASGALACVRSADGSRADPADQVARVRNRSDAASLQRQSQHGCRTENDRRQSERSSPQGLGKDSKVAICTRVNVSGEFRSPKPAKGAPGGVSPTRTPKRLKSSHLYKGECTWGVQVTKT